jgi:uncharacterized membrane protein
MKYKTYRVLKLIIVVIAGALIAWSAVSGNTWPVPALAAGAAAILLFSRGTKENATDERVYAIAEKASRLTFRAVVLLMAAAATTLLVLSRSSHPELETAGFALAYTVGGLLVIYLISYYYYSHKMGGRTE